MVKSAMDDLEAAIIALTPTDELPHVLLTNQIAPRNIRHPNRAAALRKSLRRATSDVQKGMDDTRRKQKLIDLAEKVRVVTANQRRLVEENEEGNGTGGEVTMLSTAVRHWVVATVLLGSSAEHLDADTKRKLSGMIVQLAARIIDDWTRLQMNIDFNVIKEELTKDETISSFPGGTDEPEETKRLIVGFVDLLEYNAMADPLRRTIGFVCEQARHRVLAKSVENANVDGLVERVIHGTWLADIDSKRGRGVLRKAILDLPITPFLRITLASHYLSRVYWSHWQKEDRLILLNTAEETIRPLDVRIDKSGIKRFIERHVEVNVEDD